jgi:hypothetical protein
MIRPTLSAVIFAFIGIILSTSYGSTEKLWQQFDEALHDGLPRTAIEHLDSILVITQEEENHGEWMTALTEKIVLEATIQGNRPEEKITRLKQELKVADPRTRLLLKTILAHWYWHYFIRNRYRFMERSQTMNLVEDDFNTWDLRRIFREIDSLYQDILHENERLASIPIEEFLDFLTPGNTPIKYRPTLFDFAAYEALDFYTSVEQAMARPEGAFKIDANSDAFGFTTAFLSYEPATTDTGSSMYKAIKIFQSLLAFHLRKNNVDAAVNLELDRLDYVKAVSYGTEKNDIYIQRLTELLEQYEDSNLPSFVAFRLAKAHGEAGDLAKAYETAERGYGRFPHSYGGEACKAYMTELTSKSLRLQTEQCIPPRPSKMLVVYKNFKILHFRIYEDKWDKFIGKKYGRPNAIDTLELRKLIARKPYHEYYIELPVTEDLKEKSCEVDLPALMPGYYRIIASWDKDFSSSTMVQHTWFWVSNMTLVARENFSAVDGLVLDAITGEPIPKVEVTQIVYDDRTPVFGDKTRTNPDGYFRFRMSSTSESVYLYLTRGDEELLLSDGVHAHGHYKDEPRTMTFFFTDRSLYRPGQIVYFKGICVRADRENQDYTTISNQEVYVYFRDVNNQEVISDTFVTNNFGSFSGSFIVPSDRLTGRMRIGTDKPSGSTWFRVEEYKRPKFTVAIDVPQKASVVNQEIELQGRAITYTDAPVSNAVVQYRIQRDAVYPYWHRWYFFYHRYKSPTQLVAHGRTLTDAEGNFELTFFAKPDPNIPPEDDPRFVYSINVDVTSPDGETRSTDAWVVLGYSAIELKLSTEDQPESNKEFYITIATQTLDGKRLAGEATLWIYRLQEPDTPIPEKLWHATHKLYGISGPQEEDTVQFASDWETWPADSIVHEIHISTEAVHPESVRITLPAGLYRVECHSVDQFGNKVKALMPIMVLPDWAQKHFPLKLPFVTSVKNDTVEVGNDLHLFWGTGYESGRCFIEIVCEERVIKRYWTERGHAQHALRFPVTEELRGGFSIHFTQVRENRAHLKHIYVTVPWDNKELNIAMETFRDKLQPGQDEIITLKIEGKKKFLRAIEMVASMYDFSLDQFSPHSWHKFTFFKRNWSLTRRTFINRVAYFGGWRNAWNPRYHYPPKRTFIRFPSHIAQDFMNYQFPLRAMVTYGKHKEFEGNFGQIMGSVTDAETGESLCGADIIIEGTDLGATTDKEGNFIIPKIPAGRWRVTASYISYSPLTYDDIQTTAGRTTTINFRLMPSVVEVRGVTAVAAAPEMTAYRAATERAAISEEALEQISALPTGVKQVTPAELERINIRRDLRETAFFYPHLIMDKKGIVKLEFTVPEALTKWKFIGFAHGKECESGTITEYAITRKDVMVQPNPPRFFREKDTIFFTAKVMNISNKKQVGRVQLVFKDAVSEQPLNAALGLDENVYSFDLESYRSKTFSWCLFIPQGSGPLSYVVVAKSKSHSDAETGIIPVLSSGIFLTESCPFHVRGGQRKEFKFDRLAEIGISETLEPYRFTIQMTSNPIWLAIQALPFLNDFPYGCSEQVFNQYYANSLAGHIANSNPRIREVFDLWKGTQALTSNLERNKDLKSVLLMETPWVVQAQNETQAKQRIAMLFEKNTMESNLNTAFTKLRNMQLEDGSWPWFPKGSSNPYITLYIVTGFGRLRHLGVRTDMSLVVHSLAYLDKWIKEEYERFMDRSLTPLIAFYLYGRSFFLKEQPIHPYAQEAVEYYLQQAEEHWLEVNSRMNQGHLALALKRFKRYETARKIMASIKERSVHDDELGMFWREDERSWWWYRAPIETQALMIEAFGEVLNDSFAVEECKVWLLKQKQTQHWRTTKATADAVYALILRGTDFLTSRELATVTLGDIEVTPTSIEAGTNFYERIFVKRQILPEFSNIAVAKKEKGIAWGGAYLQYFEDLERITSYTTNLQLDKELFVNRDTKHGRFIEPLTSSLEVGDLITNRIILKADRNMEYVHLKDLRGSGLEPVDVLSGYKYQDGLRYYQSTRDAATHFFIDYLPKGTYVFEYDLRVQLRGQYQNGIVEIQCMYAPEFSSHSQSRWLMVE